MNSETRAQLGEIQYAQTVASLYGPNVFLCGCQASSDRYEFLVISVNLDRFLRILASSISIFVLECVLVKDMLFLQLLKTEQVFIMHLIKLGKSMSYVLSKQMCLFLPLDHLNLWSIAIISIYLSFCLFIHTFGNTISHQCIGGPWGGLEAY